MQICDCTVRLSGDQLHAVRKRGVTVAEIYLLRQIHGADAVIDIQPVKQDKRSHEEERDRLRKKYRRQIQNVNPDGASNIVDSVYGGPDVSTKMPVNLKDIGVEYPTAAKGGTKGGTKGGETGGES